jgi:hypothetical protein
MDKIVGIVMDESIDTIEFTLKGMLMREITKLIFNVLALIALSFVVKYARTMIAQKVTGYVTGTNQLNIKSEY